MQCKQCVACGQTFWLRPQVPEQCYCAEAACQRERRRRWQQAKRQNDPDYRDNQKRAHDAWCERHPDYWREYRRTHPQYAARNRIQQQRRDGQRREHRLAKMDAWTVEITSVSALLLQGARSRAILQREDVIGVGE